MHDPQNHFFLLARDFFCLKSHHNLLVLVQVRLQRRPLGDQLQEGSPAMRSGLMIQPAANYRYPLVIIEHSHGKWPIEIDGLPIKNGDFPWLCWNHQMVPGI